MDAQKTNGEALVCLLEEYGVDTVFGIPGVHNLELYRGFAGSNIRHVLPRHEQGAGFMADGYARISGKPGVCFLITGPGVTNCATPMGQAYSDSVPMLVISSENPRETLGKGYGCLHETEDQSAVTRPLCAFSETPTDGEEIPHLVARAFDTFQAERPRPVHLSIPLDLLGQAARSQWSPRGLSSKPGPDQSDVKQAVALLNQARNPVILVGGGAKGAAGEITELCEKLDCPVIGTVGGKDVMASDHPLSLEGLMWSAIGDDILADSDLVLAIGSELSRNDTFSDIFKMPDKLIRIDIDPKEFDLRFNYAVAIQADATLACSALLEALGSGTAMREGRARAAFYRAKPHDGFNPELEPRHRTVLDKIGQALPHNAIVVGDMTQIIYTAATKFTLPPQGRFLYPSGYGTLGYALPAAIGAKIAAPDRAVLAVAGDSGFLYTASEMAVASELGLNLVVLVWNNSALGQIRDDMVRSRIQTIGVTPTPPDFAALSKAFHWSYALPDSSEDIAPALEAAFNRNGPTLIEVVDGMEGLASWP